MSLPPTIIFDLDGTLYEDERVYERFIRELARSLPPERQRELLAAWEEAQAGQGPAQVGLGYDRERDLLFHWDGNRITGYRDWAGRELPPDPEPKRTEPAEPESPPVEVPLFGPERISVGDRWALAGVLATHHGVDQPERQAAFTATREAMRGELAVVPEPWLEDLLARLRAAGRRLTAMSNSPIVSVDEVIDQLGVRSCLDAVLGGSKKPAGLTTYLQAQPDPAAVLSIGDNYVNDIEPALLAGSRALFIDRHHTDRGAGCPGCVLVPSREAMRDWLLACLERG